MSPAPFLDALKQAADRAAADIAAGLAPAAAGLVLDKFA
jgi:predicted transcriptional regulator